jgi:GT2 family glycosyltransferase
LLLFFKKEDLLSFWRRRQRPERVIDRGYRAWLKRESPAAAWRARVAAAGPLPRISVVMPVHDPNPVWLRDAIASVRGQIFSDWELIIADDASADPAVATVLAECGADPRIHIVRLEKRGGISAATNAALARADGDYVAFLDHDDMLAPHALAAVACAFAEDPRLDLVFSDEDQIVHGRRAAPYFKPGWNPDLFLSQNLVCHLAVYRRELVSRLGGLRGEVVGAQDYDLALRVVDEIGAHRVRHLPLVLYHWRQSEGSFSATQAEACQEAARRAVAWHLHGRASVGTAAALPQWPDVRFNLPVPAPSVSIIGTEIPPGTAYDPVLLKIVADAAQATGDVLVFLSPDLRPGGEGWLGELVAQACRPEIGAAGALLLGPDGGWLHTGYELHPRRVAQSVAPRSDANDPGYRGQFALPRSVAAVSLDCLAVRRDVFVAAGGLNPAARDFAGVDLCLRLAARGLRTVWTPHARHHYMRRPRALSAGAAWMRQRWGKALAEDPYRNPNLRLAGGRLFLA